jgi:hypothetical protein
LNDSLDEVSHRGRAMSAVRRLLDSDSPLYAIGIALFLLYSIVILIHPVEGYDYNIYKFFAEQANSGVDVFHMNPEGAKIPTHYLDFTPASLLQYRILFYIQDHWIPRFFYLFQVALGLINILLAYALMRDQSMTGLKRLSVVFILCISPAWVVLSVESGEDKMIFAVGPLLLAWLLARNKIPLFVLAASIFAGITAYALLFLPIVGWIWFSQFESRKPELGDIAVVTVAGVLLLALLFVFFPDCLVMYHNRSVRVSEPPFWYSIWLAAPSLYSSTLNYLVLAAACLAVYVLFYFRRIDAFSAFIAVQFIFVLFSNFSNHYRVVAFLFLPLLAIQGRRSFYVYFLFVFVQLHYDLFKRLLNFPFNQGTFAQIWWEVVLTNMSLIAFLVILALEARDRSSKLLAGSAPTQAALESVA